MFKHLSTPDGTRNQLQRFCARIVDARSASCNRDILEQLAAVHTIAVCRPLILQQIADMQSYRFVRTDMHWQFSIPIATLAAFCVALIWRAMRCSAGWRAWICYRLTMLHDCLFTRCLANNACTIPETGSSIIVANHSSPLDPSLLWIRHFAGFRKRRLRIIGFLMAQEYYHQRGLVGWISRAMESIPLERSGRDMAPIRKALRRLERGELLDVFPEGGINLESPDERLRPGGTGVAWLALKSQAPVIPIFIHGAPRSRSMVRAFLARSKTRLTYGSPVDLSAWYGRKPTQRDLIDVTNRIMQSLAGLGGIQMTPIPNDSTGSGTAHLPD